jgi:hypothetical protein
MAFYWLRAREIVALIPEEKFSCIYYWGLIGKSLES